jgi:hypothetical protein
MIHILQVTSLFMLTKEIIMPNIYDAFAVTPQGENIQYYSTTLNDLAADILYRGYVVLQLDKLSPPSVAEPF